MLSTDDTRSGARFVDARHARHMLSLARGHEITLDRMQSFMS